MLGTNAALGGRLVVCMATCVGCLPVMKQCFCMRPKQADLAHGMMRSTVGTMRTIMAEVGWHG